jgi:hypothetical protein
LETYCLTCHPDTPARAITHLTAQVELRRDDIWLTFVAEGQTQELSVPARTKPYRADGLWSTTCFELFVKDQDQGYLEFNFSPSGQWAAYQFANYRELVRELGIDHPPIINVSDEGYALILSVLLPRMAFDGMTIALSAVIEELDGTKSYWALAHPSDKPDFHHPTCFAATLPPPSAA